MLGENPINLVTTIASFITPMIANRIASALGVNSGLVTTAITAIIPALLAGMASKASTPAGAGALFDMLGKQDPSLLGSYADQIGGANQTSIINGGTHALTGLLGGSSLGALTSAVGKFAGASPSQASGLVGMLAPVVLGQLASQIKTSGLDAGGFANLLASQKQNIAAAMPSGFADMLGGSGLLDGVKDVMPKPPLAAAPASMPRPASSAPTPQPGFNWIPYAAAAAGIIGLLYLFGGGMTKPVAPPVTQNAPATAPTAATVAAVNATETARKIFTDLTTTLGTVRNAATAQSALPKLSAASTAIDGLTSMAGGLNADGKSGVAKLVALSLPQVSGLAAAALKVPGAEAILKPVLDQILAKLTTLSK